MQRWKPFVVLVATATVATSLMVGTAVAAPDGDRQAEHQRIVDFWTPERVAQAIPRDFILEPGKGFVQTKKPDNPGKPGGGGDDGGTDPDSSLVTGASWNDGGTVVDTTGKVLFQMGGSYYVCSASVVADDSTTDEDSVILTAAHCVYDESRGQFATNWMFIPAYDTAPAPLDRNGTFCEDTAYGCWTAAALTVHNGYAAAGGFTDEAAQYDFAFATVYEGGKDGATVLDHDNTVGSQAISFGQISVDPAATVHAFGYPAAQKYKGNDLVYCAGPVQAPANGDPTYRIECDMTGGSSGGPWFSPFTDDLSSDAHGTGVLVSVNSYGYRGDTGMYGPKFNENTRDLHVAADNAPVGDTSTNLNFPNTIVGSSG